MSTIVLNPAVPVTWYRAIAELFRREPQFAGAALCLAGLMAPTAVAMAVDQRTVLGINVWIKPLKFELALAIYLATLAWFSGWLPRGMTASRRYRAFAAVVVLAIAAEIVWVGGAVAFGVGSHFNVSTPAMAAIYPTMGVLAVVLTSASLVYGVAILRDGRSALEPVFRLSVGVGLVVTFVLTVIVASYLSSRTGHRVGGGTSDGGGLAILGWARDGGDLRVPHFFATHAMHAIPAFGYMLGRASRGATGRAGVILFAAAYCALVLFTLAQAASGRPLLLWSW